MAWWLLYEELYGDMDKEYPIMSEKFKDDVTIVGGAGTDTIEIKGAGDYVSADFPTGNLYAADTISLDFGGDDLISFVDADSGIGNTAYDDSKYFTYNFGDDPYPTIGSALYTSTNSPVQDEVDEVYQQYSFPSMVHWEDRYSGKSWEDIEKPQPDLTREQTQKYGEDKGIADLKDYVSSTYSGHYTSQNNNVQTLDLIQSVGDAESFCRSNAIKYLSRYDKKGQAKRDILKAMHYCLLLYYFSGQTNETPTRGYETF